MSLTARSFYCDYMDSCCNDSRCSESHCARELDELSKLAEMESRLAEVDRERARILHRAIVRGDVAKEARKLALRILKLKGMKPKRLLVLRLMNHPDVLELAERRIAERIIVGAT